MRRVHRDFFGKRSQSKIGKEDHGAAQGKQTYLIARNNISSPIPRGFRRSVTPSRSLNSRMLKYIIKLLSRTLNQIYTKNRRAPAPLWTWRQ